MRESYYKSQRNYYGSKEDRIFAIGLLYEVTIKRKIEITDEIYNLYSTMTYSQIISPIVIYYKSIGKSDSMIRIKLRTSYGIVGYITARLNIINKKEIMKMDY